MRPTNPLVRPNLRPFIIAVLALMTAGCQDSAPAGSGFLDSYADLEVHPEHPNAYRWLKPGMDLRPYDMLLFDPVEYRPLPGSNMEQLTPELIQKATEGYRRILMETLEPYYDIATEPAPHVLRVRAAVTDLVPTTADHVGGVAMEVEIRDSVDGTRLGCGIDRIEGSTRGTTAPAEWRAVQGAYHDWADRLLAFMNQYAAGE